MRYGIGILLIGILTSSAWGQIQQQSESLELPFQLSADSVEIEELVNRADSLVRAGNIQQSIQFLQRYQTVADSLNNAHLIQSINIQQARNYLNYDQPDSAEKIISQTLERFPDTDKKAQLLSLLGNVYQYKGQYQQALEKQEEAKALVDSTEQPLMYGRINLNTASIHKDTGNFGTAFKYYLEGIEIFEAEGDSVLLGTALNNLGVAYNDYSEPKNARYYLERAIEINEKVNRVDLLRATNNLAISNWNLENYDEAISLYNRALSLHNEIRKGTPPFRILYNMGQLYKDMGDLDEAEEHYQQSLAYSREAGIPQGLIYNYGGLANVAELRNDSEMARDYYSRALQQARQIGAAPLERDALNSLYQLEKRNNNYQEALSRYEEYVSVVDSLDEISKQQQLAETETKLNLERQEEMNQLLQEKQQQQQARISAQNWLIAAGVAIIGVILGSLYLLYRSNTEKRKINEELISQRNELEELNKVKDKILAILAHDLRSPLTSMQGMLYLFREGDFTPQEMQEMAAELEVSVNENISMMENLLAWARDQMSGLSLDIKPVNAADVVESVIDNYEFQARHKGISLQNNVKSDPKVKADFNLLKLILRNLLSNSIKFSNRGDSITVATREKEGYIIFEVEDTGIGIPEEKQEQLFAIGSESRMGTQNEKGTGLGLQLCKEFVEKQSGEIHLESTSGEGTTFMFSLPKF